MEGRSRKPSGRKPRATSTGSGRRNASSTPHAGVYGRWFPDATCNITANALDRHVAAGRGEQVAFYYDSPVTQTKRRITYAELLAEVETLAAVLADFGVGKGRPRHHLHADDPGGDLRHARLRAHWRGAFRRVRRLRRQGARDPYRGRRAEADPGRLLRRSRARASSNTSRCSIAALELSRHKPARVLLFQRPQATGRR